jgi:hypothetical protein
MTAQSTQEPINKTKKWRTTMQTNHEETTDHDTTTTLPPVGRFLLDHDEEYHPIVVISEREAGHQIVGQAPYSLAENSDSLDLLSSLAQFVQDWHSHLAEQDLPHSVTHRLAAQFIYLAYWKAIHTELRVDRTQGKIYVSVRFPQHPALTGTLAQFSDPMVDAQSASALQNWLRFVFETVAEHAPIWQIGLAVDWGVYEQFAPEDLPRVLFVFTDNAVKE